MGFYWSVRMQAHGRFYRENFHPLEVLPSRITHKINLTLKPNIDFFRCRANPRIPKKDLGFWWQHSSIIHAILERRLSCRLRESAHLFLAKWMTHFDLEASATEHLGIYLMENVLLFLHNCRERKCYDKHLAFALRCIKLNFHR